MAYKIKEGVREVAFQASYAQRWEITWANIFIDCPTCDQSIGLKFDTDGELNEFSDKDFIKIVRERGWEFIPNKKIVCPKCLTKEEIDDNQKSRALDHIENLPEPTYEFNVGDRVSIGNLRDVVILESLEDGKIYKVDHTDFDNNYGHPIIKEHVTGYWRWIDIRPLQKRTEETLIKNQDLELYYSQREMTDILSKKYFFGLEMNPEYQRGYVWDNEDKINLVDSIFHNIDIGKFVFVRLEWEEHPLNLSYEILDGKQRINAITEYFENRFPYNGFFFNELSKREQNHFQHYKINTAELSHLNREQKIRYFLSLNTSGKIMDAEHLKKVEKMLEKK